MPKSDRFSAFLYFITLHLCIDVVFLLRFICLFLLKLIAVQYKRSVDSSVTGSCMSTKTKNNG